MQQAITGQLNLNNSFFLNINPSASRRRASPLYKPYAYLSPQIDFDHRLLKSGMGVVFR